MSHDPLIARLIEICHEHKTAEKWLILPSLSLGHTIADRIALSGQPWVNLRVTTPLQIAQGIAAPILAARRVAPLPDTIGPALMTRLLADLPVAGRSYFRGLVECPGLSEALWSAITELRLSGLRVADLSNDKFVFPLKAGELRGLLVAYERYLNDASVADAAAMYHVALDHPPSQPKDVPRYVLVATDTVWQPLEARLISACPGTRLDLPHAVPHGLEVPRRLGHRVGPCAVVTHPPQASTDSARMAWLFAPDQAPAPANDGTLEWFHAAGHEAEVQEVFRRALASGAPWDTMEIACVTDDPYLTLIWEMCERLGIPVTLASGLPVAVTRPGRALLAFCRWIENDLSGAQLRRVLQSGDITLDLSDGPTPNQAARVLARCEITWGRDMYGPAMANLVGELREELEQAVAEGETAQISWRTQRVAHAEALSAWVQTILALVPSADSHGRVDTASLARGCAEWVGRYGAAASPLDGVARQQLSDALTALGTLFPVQQPLTLGLTEITAITQRLRVGVARAHPGHLHVTGLPEAGRAGRPWTFVVGLDQGTFPGSAIPDPILLDHERSGLHPELATSRDRLTERLYHGASRVAALGGRITLSYASRDLRDDRRLFPSSILLQTLRLQRSNSSLTYDDLTTTLGEPATRIPATQVEALDSSGWWLRGVRQAGREARRALDARFPCLARGDAAEAGRDSLDLTAWDGMVPGMAGLLDPRATGQAISATALEKLASCAFRYFLTYGLRLEPPTDIERDPSVWLDARRRGTLLHGVFAAFLRDCRARKTRPDAARDTTTLRELGDHAIAAMRTRLPPPAEWVFERERDELLNDVEVFLGCVAGFADREVIGIEVPFGFETSGRPDPLAQEEPVTLDLGPELRFALRGRIDRIDRLGPHEYEVVDYKTGYCWRPTKRDALLGQGQRVQHALYALAAEQLLRKRDRTARVVSAAYWFPTRRGELDRITRTADTWRALPDLLRQVFSLLKDGVFPHTHDETVCRRCEYADACGAKPWQRAKAKREQGTDARLNPLRALQGYA